MVITTTDMQELRDAGDQTKDSKALPNDPPPEETHEDNKHLQPSAAYLRPDAALNPTQGHFRSASNIHRSIGKLSHTLRAKSHSALTTLQAHFHYNTPRSPPEPRGETPRLFVGTWNMNARVPSRTVDLSSFLAIGPQKDCHLIAIGTQECEERLEIAGIRQPKERLKWIKAMRRYIREEDYALAVTKTLVGLHLAIFVKRAYIDQIQAIQTSELKVYMNGAKGAVGASFRFLGRSVAFVNAHLMAHEGRPAYDRRNADWNKINETLLSGDQNLEKGQPLSLAQRFDYIFWMGDLNYRADFGPGATAWARALLSEEPADIRPFLIHDELRKAQTSGIIFPGYSEAEITFKPTFKYNVPLSLASQPSTPLSSTPRTPVTPVLAPVTTATTDETSSLTTTEPDASGPTPGYDSSSKQRMPSYTDRVLFSTRILTTKRSIRATTEHRPPDPLRTASLLGAEPSSLDTNLPAPLGAGKNRAVEVEAYTDCPSIFDSDHKPVYGVYRLLEEEIIPPVNTATSVPGIRPQDDRPKIKRSSPGCWRWCSRRTGKTKAKVQPT
ncbi:Endonuclease/exonuclease/phosphatase [Fimicolochytrium jonesii]|uniref:Endonuclease/exonuclease/phosphatase n=1 Tax=Fimicolochytrium jonesii TaxID=1396493 RepID=UPI0022FE54A1|nr:Endonuclease/exonuclease/phosphatase [Fimicolochytrium jonesii]KAI8826726.1 Endonuclease/exonuclease/phosphatase [Fimicolochytrium jonesii]